MATRYQNIADALRSRIVSEEWPPGTRLPAEAELASQHSVSGPTLRRRWTSSKPKGSSRSATGSATSCAYLFTASRTPAVRPRRTLRQRPAPLYGSASAAG
ncbi:GntR family transcriptional regulator [Streptomyces sp. F63]|uniref:GntR family transcriptional regulator n=1 Tax=Streptomyces sp. F63 TaxID=2824887 RepID=UPI001B395ED7|nr:GntR family transcriptional regulator [Streptomyces sp. F63]